MDNNLKPILSEFPFDTVSIESQIREKYLSQSFLPALEKQFKENKFVKILELLLYKKIGGYGKGRSGGSAKDFISGLKKIAKYNGRIDQYGKIRPQAQYIEDLTATRFPEGSSVLVLISGRGTTKDVISKALGAVDTNIDIISMTYRINSQLAKLSTISIYIPQKLVDNSMDVDERQRHAPIDVMGNSFETGASIKGRGIVEGLAKFHETNDKYFAAKHSYQYIKQAVDYISYLNKHLYEYREEIIKLGKAIAITPHIRMASAGDGAASLKIAMNRLSHMKRTGFGRTIDFISSDDFGPPGCADIEKGDCVILGSSSLKSFHTISIAKEATRADADIYLITSDRLEEKIDEWLKKYKIKQPSSIVCIPYSLPNFQIRYFDLGLRHLLEYIVPGASEYIGLKKEDLESSHIQSELE